MRRFVQNKANYRESKGKAGPQQGWLGEVQGSVSPSFPLPPFPLPSPLSIPHDLGFQTVPWSGRTMPTSSQAKRAGDGKGRWRKVQGRGEGEEASSEPPPPAGSRSQVQRRAHAWFISCLARNGMRSMFPSLSEQRTSETLEGGVHTSDHALELCPLSTPKFQHHPNTGIRWSKFQIADSEPGFLHPNRP
jgi:hypothetical protein